MFGSSVEVLDASLVVIVHEGLDESKEVLCNPKLLPFGEVSRQQLEDEARVGGVRNPIEQRLRTAGWVRGRRWEGTRSGHDVAGPRAECSGLGYRALASADAESQRDLGVVTTAASMARLERQGHHGKAAKQRSVKAHIIVEAKSRVEEQGKQQHESPTTEVLPGTSGGGAGLHANKAVVEVAVGHASTTIRGALGS